MKNLSIGVVSSSSRVLRRLGDQRLLAEHHQLVALAGEFQVLRAFRRSRRRGRLRERRRDHAARHIGGERNRAADRGAHGGRTASQKSAAADAGLASEHDGIGAFGIVTIKLFERALGCPGHSHILPGDFLDDCHRHHGVTGKKLLPERTSRNGPFSGSPKPQSLGGSAHELSESSDDSGRAVR